MTWSPRLDDLSQVPIVPRRWLWEGRIPRAALSISTGDPDAGKTYVHLDLSIRVCDGLPFPDGKVPVAGRVLFVDGENGNEEIKRRLSSMGLQNWNAFRVLSMVQDGAGAYQPLSLEKHKEAFEEAIRNFRPSWVIIDPLVAFHSRNEIKATEVRPFMTWLAKLAEGYDVAITVVQHPSKGAQEKDLYRVRGSLDLVAAARGLTWVKLDQATGQRTYSVGKLNLGVKGPELTFKIEHEKVVWLGVNALPAAPLSQMQQAIAFLQNQLATGPVPASQLKTAAQWQALAWSTVERAKKSLNVTTKKASGTRSGEWSWSLPGGVGMAPQQAGLGQLGGLDDVADLFNEDDQDPQDRQHDQDSQQADGSWLEVHVPAISAWPEFAHDRVFLDEQLPSRNPPSGVVVYSRAEAERLKGASGSALRLIHACKRRGAKLL